MDLLELPQRFDDIVKYIVYRCREKQVQEDETRESNNKKLLEQNIPIQNDLSSHIVSDTLVAYVLKVLYNQQTNKFYFQDSDTLSATEARKVIEEVISFLELKEDGILETIKLQLTYELAHLLEEEKVEKIKQYFDKEINDLIREIITFQPSSKKDHDSIQIHKKIFNVLLIKTRQTTLDSLNHFSSEDSKNLGIASEKEIYAALDNVLPKSGLSPFVSLSSQDKIAQLTELSNIIMGIRLLNKELGKGGIGLMSLNDLRKKLSNDFLNDVKSYYNVISDLCDKFVDVYSVDFSNIVDQKDLNILEQVRKYIIFYRQVLTYLALLIGDLNTSSIVVDNLSLSYEKEIKYLIELVDKKSAISKEQVYPRFESLAKLYSKFQEQFFIVDIRENVLHNIQVFIRESSIPTSFNSKELSKFISKENPYQDKALGFNFESGQYQNGVTVYLPHNTADYMDIKLDFQGFCIVTLLEKGGLIVNGRQNLVVKYKDKCMVFSTPNAVQDFLYDPDKYMSQVLDYVKRNSYLINLLGLVEEFPNANFSDLFRNKDSDCYKYKDSKVRVDRKIQTSLHPELENLTANELRNKKSMDKDYVWNEWELKKQALQKADIMNKATVGCQTLLSHFRRENEAQVYALKETGVSTTVSTGTNISIPKNYIPNLRKYDTKY